MEKHLLINAYISKLILKIQLKKKNLIKVYLHFRNQNLEELFPNVRIALRIYYCMAFKNYLGDWREIVFVSGASLD